MCLGRKDCEDGIFAVHGPLTRADKGAEKRKLGGSIGRVVERYEERGDGLEECSRLRVVM